jgi:radical SAM superfamily enzyme YgiQ (UPF0313 family)
MAGEAGIKILKLYFMLGLPGNSNSTKYTDEAAVFLREIGKAFLAGSKKITGKKLRAVFSPFVPKPGTPLQWAPLSSREELIEEFSFIAHGSGFSKNRDSALKVESSGIRTAYHQVVIARGGRTLFPILKLVALDKISWKKAIEKMDPEEFTGNSIEPGRVLPWEFLLSNGEFNSFMDKYRSIIKR